ncbi:histone deacetylase family protein [Pararhizobium mangrovi]|uniref:Histone deacetylase n=1 Tax=Pararhizobium mangrovi TaxID=2590452 RepID=A0A506TYK4_9HYPH|nr:histone deacetylase [Pararhizobium mangrovi]TPW25804.1 histone deacetylase [Pararhizobium mangrovi]
MPLPIIHKPDYDAQFSPNHRFPMAKYSKLAAILRAEGLLTDRTIRIPELARAEWLELAHRREYVEQVVSCRVPRETERLIGFPVDERVSRRALSASGGTVLAARLALSGGLACNTAGGSHHARRAHGAGFCTFNDVGVAASLLLAERAVSRVLVFDCDVHQGDGTAEIFMHTRQVFTVSLHAAKNYPVRKVPSDMDVPLPDGLADDAYVETVEKVLPNALAASRPDIVFYNAGVDPHEGDRLGRLSLTDEGLRRRDHAVIGFFRKRAIPLVGVIGGGYSRDADAVAARHAILFRTAAEYA